MLRSIQINLKKKKFQRVINLRFKESIPYFITPLLPHHLITRDKSELTLFSISLRIPTTILSREKYKKDVEYSNVKIYKTTNVLSYILS